MLAVQLERTVLVPVVLRSSVQLAATRLVPVHPARVSVQPAKQVSGVPADRLARCVHPAHGLQPRVRLLARPVPSAQRIRIVAVVPSLFHATASRYHQLARMMPVTARMCSVRITSCLLVQPLETAQLGRPTRIARHVWLSALLVTSRVDRRYVNSMPTGSVHRRALHVP